MRYAVTCAKDGDLFRDSVEAEDQERAETAGRDLIADAWSMRDTLDRCRAEGDESEFDSYLDAFAVDPDPLALDVDKVAETFAAAKEAPTSFEDEQWLEGFEAARRMIAERLAAALDDDDRESFLQSADVADVAATDVCETCAASIETRCSPCDECGHIDELDADDSDLEEAAEGEKCGACGRPSIECSRAPCQAVALDRGALAMPIPADFPVQPIIPGHDDASAVATCGHCGLSWDDSKPSAFTPAPAGRCPFEAFHG